MVSPSIRCSKPLSFTDRGDNNTFRFILGNDIAIQAAESGHISPWPDGTRFAKLPADSKWEHGIIMAEGDYVMVHSRYSNPDGSAIVVVDIMRIEDGIFQEHDRLFST